MNIEIGIAIGQILFYCGTVFILYRLLVKSKDAQIELLQEKCELYNPTHAKAHIDILEKRISQLEEDKNNILIQNKELDSEMEKLIKENQDDTVLNLKLIEELKKAKKKEDALKLDQETQRKEFEGELNKLKSKTYDFALATGAAAFLNEKLKEKTKQEK